LAEGLICGATSLLGCGNPVQHITNDAGPRDSGMDADMGPRDARPDSRPDSDMRPDAEALADAEAGIDADSCPGGYDSLDCPTGNAENVEVFLHLGDSMVVENVRITALRTEGFSHVVSLHCDSTDEEYVAEGLVPQEGEASFTVDTAQVDIRWVGAIGGLSIMEFASVSTPCPEPVE
jgi:hypothetical protein